MGVMMQSINKGDAMSQLKYVRQGEVLLMPIKDKVIGASYNAFIVGHSETGHHHVLESDKPFVISEQDKQFVVELFVPAKLVHKKTFDMHNTLTVAPGRYKVIYKQEYDPWEKVIRNVSD